MAVYDYPVALKPETMEWGTTKAGVQFRSPFDGSIEAVGFPGDFWTLSIGYPPQFDRDSGALSAFWEHMAGGINKVRVPHFLRPVPQGSMRGTPTLAAAASRGDSTLQITTTGGLKAGDFIGVGNQLCRALFDCDPVGGTLTVTLVNRIRAAVSSGSPVTWDHPTATFIYPSKTCSTSFSEGVSGRSMIDLVESP